MPQRLIDNLKTSISVRIVLSVTLPLLVLAAFFASYHYRFERAIIFRNAETELLHIGEGLKAPAEALLANRDYTALQAKIEEAAREPEIILITVVNSRGKVVSCNRKQWLDAIMIDMHPEALSSNDISAIQKAMGGGYAAYYDERDEQSCLVIPLTVGSSETGALYLSLDVTTTWEEIKRRAIRGYTIAVASAIVIGILSYFLFHTLFTKRILAISAAAADFANGDVGARTSVQGADEIGQVARSFNELADEVVNWRNHLEAIAAERLSDLSTLYEVVETISQSLELASVLPHVMTRVLYKMQASKGAIVLMRGECASLQVISSHGLSEASVEAIASSGQGGIGDVILRNRPLQITHEDDEAVQPIPGLDSDGIVAALIAPIAARGSVLGAIAIYSDSAARFTDQDESLLLSIGNQIGIAVENARLYEKTLELAQIDGLTQVANRRYLMERLREEVTRAERYQTSLSVIMLDLDKFKSFNDMYGHLKGDELLKSFSAVLKREARTSDIAGRYGGEEFCIVLPNTSLKGAAVIAERIRKATEALRIVVSDDQPPAGRTVSIGIAEFGSGQAVEQLLTVADNALYRAKEGGRNRVVA